MPVVWHGMGRGFRHSRGMFETDAELAELQILLETSLPRSTEHLRSIIRSGEKTLTAAQLTVVCAGMCTMALSPVTGAGEPGIGGVGGPRRHGQWYFSPAGSAARARPRAARPAVSIAYIRGEEVGVFAHGTAQP